MDSLKSTTVDLLYNSISPNTLLAYNLAKKQFSVFRTKLKLPEQWPAPEPHIALFIAHCFENGLSPRTIRTYISGINYFHKLHGWLDLTNLFLIKKLLEGCNRSSSTKDDRVPVTFKILVQLTSKLPTVCVSPYEVFLFKALWVLAYFGLFRVSELVTTGCISNQIQFHNVSINTSHLTIILGKHKTNQLGKPVELKIPTEPFSPLCPVRQVGQFLAVRPSSYNGPLFCHADGSPVTRYQFATVLNKCIIKAGLSNSKIRTHSFRMGRATDLAGNAVPAGAIMKLGRWSSDAYKSYIR